MLYICRDILSMYYVYIGMNVFPARPSSADAITEVWAEVSFLGLLPTDPRRAATVGPGQTKISTYQKVRYLISL